MMTVLVRTDALEHFHVHLQRSPTAFLVAEDYFRGFNQRVHGCRLHHSALIRFIGERG